MTDDEPDLVEGELELVGRITIASNATFLATVGDVQVVYKPVAGERPLWDFPDETLANREVAAYLVSESFGWDVVPTTVLRDGPLGPGMVQRWREPDAAQDPVDVVPAGAVPPDGWRAVFRGVSEKDQPLVLVHEDSAALRRMAVFDVVVNNADRKGGHVLPMADGHRYGVDHGVTFHVEHKLRTVLWGWRGEELRPDEVAGVARVRAELDGGLGGRLAGLLSDDELAALAMRCDRLLRDGVLPGPGGDMPAFPWPFF
ncbi:SCO1664 family protein [Cellulomonas sp. DKR-3]|uniref:SCO1664 family protein n=1 Tax=Cellulomonas fulva TaxID=2835530 RepID=A0ABS5U2F0_9CELL|nr:SCO1664 family protein [Cellulomonas fulva]MBT0995542.1 SCO1664 family protein [Cellulomonas fulva]